MADYYERFNTMALVRSFYGYLLRIKSILRREYECHSHGTYQQDGCAKAA